jgi:isoquinoline 1-oxidoreductase subunit beta
VKLTRRTFLAGLGAGLVIGVHDLRAGRAAEPTKPAAASANTALAPNVLVHIALDGTTTIVCHRSEMGQGVRSTIPLLIADELGADPSRIVVKQADGDAKYGDQNTDGSSSIRKFYDHLRKSGAAARMMLVAAAAKRWKVKPETIVVADHMLAHPPSKRSAPFSELVADAAKLPVPKPEAIVLRPHAALTRVHDTNLPVFDGLAHVTGTATYGADVMLPGLLIAVIRRPPVVGGKVDKLSRSLASSA